MKAIQMLAPGGLEQLRHGEVPEPELRDPRQVKVRLKAAGVNPVDTKLRSRGLLYPDALPAILGCDGSGVVVEAGAAVSRWRVGDEVWFCNGGLGGDQGNYADYTLVDESVARRKPTSLDHRQAAAAPLVLITAWEALYDRAELKAGQTVLVHGGAGGVGHVAVQLARLRGARVCATVGSDANAAWVGSLGAERSIRHDREDFVTAVHDWTDGRGVDVALDVMGGEVFRRSLAAMAHYGTLVTLLDPGPDVDWKEARNRNLRIGFELMLTPLLGGLPEARAHQGEILDQCARWCDEGRLHIEVAQVFPLAEAAAAHGAIETGHTRGKLVLEMTD